MIKINTLLLFVFVSSLCYADKISMEKNHVDAMVRAIFNSHDIYEEKLFGSKKIDGMILLPYLSSMSLLLSHRYMADSVMNISDGMVCKMSGSINKIRSRFSGNVGIYSDIEIESFSAALDTTEGMINNLSIDCGDEADVSEINRQQISEWKDIRKRTLE